MLRQPGCRPCRSRDGNATVKNRARTGTSHCSATAYDPERIVIRAGDVVQANLSVCGQTGWQQFLRGAPRHLLPCGPLRTQRAIQRWQWSVPHSRTPLMPWRFTLLAAAALALLFPLAATAADPPHDTADVLKQNFVAEHEIGHRNQIDAGNLPAPKTGAIVTSRPLTLPYAGQVLPLQGGACAVQGRQARETRACMLWLCV